MQDCWWLLKDARKPISHHLSVFFNLFYAHLEKISTSKKFFFLIDARLWIVTEGCVKTYFPTPISIFKRFLCPFRTIFALVTLIIKLTTNIFLKQSIAQKQLLYHLFSISIHFKKLRYIEVKVTLYRVTLYRGCLISRLPYIEVWLYVD